MKKNFLFLGIALCAVVFAACAYTNNPGVLTPPGGSTGTTNNPGVPDFTAVDSDATNFISRAGLDPRGVQAEAVTVLVYELKRANLWTNFDALYPFVGGSNGCGQNLVSTNWPITWTGGVSFSKEGVTGNGSDAWGDTGYLQSSRGALTNNFHLYAWVKKSNNEAVNGAIIANQNGAESRGGVFTFGAFIGVHPLSTNGDYFGGTGGIRIWGNAIANRSGVSNLLMGDDPAIFTNLVAGVTSTPTNSVRIFGLFNDSPGFFVQGYAPATVGAASFGYNLTAAQGTNYFNIMSRFEARLHRVAQ